VRFAARKVEKEHHLALKQLAAHESNAVAMARLQHAHLELMQVEHEFFTMRDARR
jgi:hypothetical protein